MLERISMEFAACFCHVGSFGRHKIRRNRIRWLGEKCKFFSLAQYDNDHNNVLLHRHSSSVLFFCLVVCTSRASHARIIFPFHGKDIINDIATAPRDNDTQNAERWALSVVCSFLHTMTFNRDTRQATQRFLHFVHSNTWFSDRTNESVNVQTKLKIYL